jgi:hypothetical protein
VSDRGDLAGAARLGCAPLEVTRPKLYRLLWSHGIEPASFRG